MPHRIIHIEPSAPAKPQWGETCNGCGVCCLTDPCPLGAVLSARRTGACLAVRWDGQASQYRCGALMAPLEVLTEALPSWVAGATPWALRALARILPRLAQRWIAAGIGCDCSLETIKP